MAKVEDFVAWRVMWWTYRALRAIREANGYNTSPLVTLDADEYADAEARNALLMECVSHSPMEHNIGGSSEGIPRVEMEISLEITGSIKLRDGEVPRKAAFALEQDVRKCLHGNLRTMVSDLGRPFVFRFGDCQHDAGVLTPEKEAGFRLFITYRYPHGSGW